MISRSTWTNNEIQSLKNSYLQGDRIKTIARQMNRTPSAVNKALARFSIRPKKELRPKAFLKVIKHPIKRRERNQFYSDKWVTLEYVVKWLNEVGVTIVVGEGGYFYGTIFLTPLALVLMANKRRLSLGEMAFYVDDVTW